MADYRWGAADQYALFNPQRKNSTPHGIELLHYDASKNVGGYKALAGATWMAGTALMPVGNMVLNTSDGSKALGFAMKSRIAAPKAVVVDQVLVLNGTAATSVGKANISNVQVRSAANFGGTLFTGGGTDYTVVAAAGTIARNGGGAISDGATVYVTFTYEMTSDELKYLGQDVYAASSNYSMNHFDSVSILQGHIQMLTASYDTSAGAVSYGSVGTALYISSAGLLTTATGSTHKVGMILQAPTSANAWLFASVDGNPKA